MSNRTYSDEQRAYIYGLREKHSPLYFYVGVTRFTPESRCRAHMDQVRTGTHMNRHFANKVRKVGAQNIVCDVLERPARAERWRVEKQWIERLAREGHPLVNRIHNKDRYGAVGYLEGIPTVDWYERARAVVSGPPPRSRITELQPFADEIHAFLSWLVERTVDPVAPKES